MYLKEISKKYQKIILFVVCVLLLPSPLVYFYPKIGTYLMAYKKI